MVKATNIQFKSNNRVKDDYHKTIITRLSISKLGQVGKKDSSKRVRVKFDLTDLK